MITEKTNASLKESFSDLDAYAIKLKVSSASLLTQFPEVVSITLDKNVNKPGHISQTTGADAASALGGNNFPYNGANSTIEGKKMI